MSHIQQHTLDNLVESISSSLRKMGNEDVAKTTPKLLAGILALNISIKVSLPTSALEGKTAIDSYWVINCLPVVEEYLNYLNEKMIFSYAEVIKLTRGFWNTRYNLVHTPISQNSIDCLLEEVKCGDFVSPSLATSLTKSLAVQGKVQVVDALQNILSGSEEVQHEVTHSH